MNNPEWYIEAFEDWYPIIYQHRNEEEAREQVEFVFSILSLNRYVKVLDLCCGYGRHLKFLSEKLNFTVGLDLSLFLLGKAKDIIGNNVSLVRGDVRNLPFPPCSFDVVLNFFTSFGYFEKHEENLQQIKQISIVLKNKGVFFFDYLNPIQAQKIKGYNTQKNYQSYIIKENRWYDETKKELKKIVHIYTDKDKLEKAYTESIKIYSLNELIKMFSYFNLRIKMVLGGYKKESFSDESQRLIIIGEKNE